MDLGIFLMNRDAVRYAKLNYMRRCLCNDQSELEFDDKFRKYKREAVEKYGKYNERWDGKPNADITQANINTLRKRYWVSDEDYQYFYSREEHYRMLMIKAMLGGN